MEQHPQTRDPEYRLMQDEMRTKKRWSGIMTGIAVVAGVVTLGLGISGAGEIFSNFTGAMPQIAGIVMSGIAAVTAGMQVNAYNKEIQTIKGKMQVHLEKNDEEMVKEAVIESNDVTLATAIEELQEEVHSLKADQAKQNRWMRQVAEERTESQQQDHVLH